MTLQIAKRKLGSTAIEENSELTTKQNALMI